MPSKRIICGDVLDVLLELGPFDCIIADPPDNIQLDYRGYDDLMDGTRYEWFLEDLIGTCMARSHATWISFNAKYLPIVGYLVHQFSYHQPDFKFRFFMQTFTFGQYNKYDCANGFRPLLRIMHESAAIYPNAIKVPSARQKAGDSRAKPGGRVPSDVWDFPRITGNCKERRDWHPTQLREAMIKRIVDFSTKPGDRICDAFSGTGTVLRAIDDRDVVSIDISPFYCKMIAIEQELKVENFSKRKAA